MTSVHSKALKKNIEVNRIIGHIKGNQPGPTLVFFAGIHGNEPSGVFALDRVITFINENKIPIRGNIYAIAGNLDALSAGIRFIDHDLNRIWTESNVSSKLELQPSMKLAGTEREALISILTILKNIIKENEGPFYFFDLHTTSSDTIPFITINDTRLNRKFALHFPVPVILGIEEHLDGPILSYVNQLGYIAVGFESGQHDELKAIDNHVTFIYHSLIIVGVMSPGTIEDSCHFLPNLIRERGKVFEIIYRHRIVNGEKFIMGPGFVNFQNIKKGQQLASSNSDILTAEFGGKIFMPLYQNQGDDGYFIIKRIPIFFLKASTLLRKIRLDVLLSWLPGIRWEDVNKKTLLVSKHIARFFAKDFLHLMGYRVKNEGKYHLSARKREDAKSNMNYKNEKWVSRKCLPNP